MTIIIIKIKIKIIIIVIVIRKDEQYISPDLLLPRDQRTPREKPNDLLESKGICRNININMK